MTASTRPAAPLEVIDTILYLAERGLQELHPFAHRRRRRPLKRGPGQTVEAIIVRRARRLFAVLAEHPPSTLDDLRRGEIIF